MEIPVTIRQIKVTASMVDNTISASVTVVNIVVTATMNYGLNTTQVQTLIDAALLELPLSSVNPTALDPETSPADTNYFTIFSTVWKKFTFTALRSWLKNYFSYFVGFENLTDSVIGVTIRLPATYNAYIRPSGANYNVWSGGEKYTKTESLNSENLADLTLYYIYIDASGNLITTTDEWDLGGIFATVATFYRDGGDYTLTDYRKLIRKIHRSSIIGLTATEIPLSASFVIENVSIAALDTLQAVAEKAQGQIDYEKDYLIDLTFTTSNIKSVLITADRHGRPLSIRRGEGLELTALLFDFRDGSGGATTSNTFLRINGRSGTTDYFRWTALVSYYEVGSATYAAMKQRINLRNMGYVSIFSQSSNPIAAAMQVYHGYTNFIVDEITSIEFFTLSANKFFGAGSRIMIKRT